MCEKEVSQDYDSCQRNVEKLWFRKKQARSVEGHQPAFLYPKKNAPVYCAG